MKGCLALENSTDLSVVSQSRKRKRKREGGESSRESSDGEDSEGEGTPNNSDSENLRSRLAKRIHTANSRRSHLSKLVISSNRSSIAGSPNGSAPDHAAEEGLSSADGSAGRESADDGDVEDSDLDEWADEFEKELD